MEIWGLASLICLVFCSLCRGELANPGLQAKITSKGFNYANQVAIDILSKKIRSLQIPAVHGSSKGVTYDLSNLKIGNFIKPRSTIAIATNGLKWNANGLGIRVDGKFHYKYKKGWVKISDGGSFDISVSGLSFSLGIILGKDKNARPSIASNGCSCNINKVDVHFHGGASWIYNLFKGKVGDMIKGKLKQMICSEAVKAVNTDAENSLSKLPVTVDIDNRFTLSYKLVKSPQFNTTYMLTDHEGKVTWKGETEKLPFSAPPLNGIPSPNKMMYLWISDFVLNSMFYSAHQNGFLKYNLTAKDLPESSRSMLDTTCSGFHICIGRLIPEIGKKCPNSQVMVSMHSSVPPNANVTNEKLNLTFGGVVSFYAEKCKKQGSQFLLSFDMSLNTSVSIWISSEKIYGKLGSLYPNITLRNSTVGRISDGAVEFMLNMVDNIVVIPKLNKVGEKGMPLPVTGMIKFSNTELILANDTLVIGTDLVYSPKNAKNFNEKNDELHFNEVGFNKKHLIHL